MSNKIKWNDLSWNNYHEIDNKITHEFKEPISGLTYLSWKYYGLNIKFAFYNDSILLIGEIDEEFYEAKRDQFINNNILDKEIKKIIFRPYFINENIDNLINICLETIGKDNNILLENFYKADLENITNKIPLWNWTTNFIYLTDKFKGFEGKKLQKKRNLLNFYKNNFSSESKLEIITKKNINKVKNFINDSKTNIEYTNIELKLYNDLLKNFNSDKMKGTILYYKNEIIGFTLGYFKNNYYEIFIEKCQKDLKGSYQYLISENLIINNINTLYVDRQDGASIESLIKSKKSYKPIKVYERNVYYIQ